MHAQPATLDRETRVAALATAQYGVVSREQLAALGFGRGALAHRLRLGRLHRLHRGVFAVGHTALTARSRWMAAVLVAGGDACLSHASAAAAWDLRATDSPLVHVTVATLAGREHRMHVRFHRHRDPLRPDEVTRLGALPITTPARTLLDLAARLPQHALERALERAEALRVMDHAELARLLTRRRAQPGARKLAALQITDEPTLTRSELEDRFLALVARHDLPRPRTNHRVLGYEVDFLWPEHRVIVESDGHRHHGTRHAFERDRARDARLILAGYRVVRLTYRQVIHAPDATAATVRALLLQAPR